MTTLPVYTAENMPLSWSILGSSMAVSGVGAATVLRHLMEGRFEGEIEGQDAHGHSLVAKWLKSFSGMNQRRSRWSSHSDESLKLLCGLLAHGSDPWQKSDDGEDALDLLFEHGVDAMVVELAPQDPAGPEHWKQRRVQRGGYQDTKSVPWLHAVAQNERMARADFDILLQLPGAEIDQLDDLGNTPLFQATTPEVVSYLLEKGANPSHRNFEGEGALGWWASSRIPATDLAVMKAALIKHGFQASGEQAENDFRDLAKSSTVGILSPIFAELGLETRVAEFVPDALDRLLSYPTYDRQKVRTAWAWLDFLVKKPNACEALSEFDQARLHLLANSGNYKEQDSNDGNRLRLRDLLARRAPMELPQAWDALMRGEPIKDSSYGKLCLENLRQIVGNRITEPGFDDLWLRMSLKDDPAARAMEVKMPLVPWIKTQKEEVDVASHPRAWELLIRSASKLKNGEISEALEVLLARNTPLPSNDFTLPAAIEGEKLALIEQAIYQARTPAAPSQRRALRF